MFSTLFKPLWLLAGQALGESPAALREPANPPPVVHTPTASPAKSVASGSPSPAPLSGKNRSKAVAPPAAAGPSRTRAGRAERKENAAPYQRAAKPKAAAQGQAPAAAVLAREPPPPPVEKLSAATLNARNKILQEMRKFLRARCWWCWIRGVAGAGNHAYDSCPETPPPAYEAEMRVWGGTKPPHTCFMCLNPTMQKGLLRDNQHAWVDFRKDEVCLEKVPFRYIFVILAEHPDTLPVREMLAREWVPAHALISADFLAEFISTKRADGGSTSADILVTLWKKMPRMQIA